MSSTTSSLTGQAADQFAALMHDSGFTGEVGTACTSSEYDAIDAVSQDCWTQLWNFVPCFKNFTERAVYHRTPRRWYRNGIPVDPGRTAELDEMYHGIYGRVTIQDLLDADSPLKQSLLAQEDLPTEGNPDTAESKPRPEWIAPYQKIENQLAEQGQTVAD